MYVHSQCRCELCTAANNEYQGKRSSKNGKEPARFDGELLRQKRIVHGWTLEQLAPKVGVDHTQVSRWEAGQNNPRPKAVKKLAKIFGIPIEGWYKGESHVGSDGSN
jgi:ribosome-binding protein aMBF1 (putative translation factor)